MINQILEETLTYFPISIETATMSIVSDGIGFTFNEDYLVGQYVNILGSVLNDGTYKITGVTSSKLTLDATLLAEENYIQLFGLALPRALTTLITEIETYAASSGNANLSEEWQGKRKVKYASGSNWRDSFSARLDNFRSVYDDRLSRCSRDYNLSAKRWF